MDYRALCMKDCRFKNNFSWNVIIFDDSFYTISIPMYLALLIKHSTICEFCYSCFRELRKLAKNITVKLILSTL